MFDSALTRLRSRPAQGALSDDQFRAIFDRCRFGMAIADERGRYVAVNEAFERLVGYTAEELEVQTWMDLTHQDDIARNLELHALEGSRSERRNGTSPRTGISCGSIFQSPCCPRMPTGGD
jgi:PAS domain S-box-containing protein